jgi:CheY-like chemotaxis protein
VPNLLIQPEPVSVRENRKLLVVDDEPLVRETLNLCFRSQYEVTAVSSGEEAIEASKRDSFPVVLLDLRMDGISGIETLRRLRQLGKPQNVIILTAYESMESAISALNLGAFNYVTKPFQPDRLREIVSRGFEDYAMKNVGRQEIRRRLMTVHDSFFSLLCHEFNTPLNIILGFAELLAGELRDAEHVSWAREIHASGSRLHDVLTEILDYVAAAHMAVEGIHSEFTLSSIIEPLVGRFHGVTIESRDSHILDRRVSGPGRCISALVKKLLQTAAHYSTHIRLVVDLASGSAVDKSRLTVKIRATGIDRAMLDQTELRELFEPYQFAPTDATGHRAGLGLELATGRKLTEYASGTLSCTADPQRGELAFFAEIPVTVAP